MPSPFQWPAGGSGWRILCGETLNRMMPDSFYLPDGDDLAALDKGDFAKVIIEIHGYGDHHRVWIRINSRLGDMFVGTLDSVIHGEDERDDLPVGCGSTVHFERRHVIDTRFRWEVNHG